VSWARKACKTQQRRKYFKAISRQLKTLDFLTDESNQMPRPPVKFQTQIIDWSGMSEVLGMIYNEYRGPAEWLKEADNSDQR